MYGKASNALRLDYEQKDFVSKNWLQEGLISVGGVPFLDDSYNYSVPGTCFTDMVAIPWWTIHQRHEVYMYNFKIDVMRWRYITLITIDQGW